MRIGRFNIGSKAGHTSKEEEEDRARLILTRRKFLFMGAAAGAAALLPKESWHEQVMRETAEWVDPSSHLVLTPQGHLCTYYSKKFLDHLKSYVSYNVIFAAGLPPTDTSRIRLFDAPMLKKDGLLFTPSDLLES